MVAPSDGELGQLVLQLQVHIDGAEPRPFARLLNLLPMKKQFDINSRYGNYPDLSSIFGLSCLTQAMALLPSLSFIV